MTYTCPNNTCTIGQSTASFTTPGNCPVCQSALVSASTLTKEDEALLSSLPYVIAYPLKRTLEEKHAWTRINLLKDTLLNYLKYLGLVAASEFFYGDRNDRQVVELFQHNLAIAGFGKWNHFIRECLASLKDAGHDFICPGLPAYYEAVETGKKRKLVKGEIEYKDRFDEWQYKKQLATRIDMLINFRNRYLGHGLTLDENISQEVWDEYYPIFRSLLVEMTFCADQPMYKHDHGKTGLLHSAEISFADVPVPENTTLWITGPGGRVLPILPFYVVPGAIGADDNAAVMIYEAHTGRTLRFFQPEGGKAFETSGAMLEQLNLMLRTKASEASVAPEDYTVEYFRQRVRAANEHIVKTLTSERKIIAGTYQSRNDIEIKLREWTGSRFGIFLLASEAGSGKTNLLHEIQRQYGDRELDALLIRMARMQKDSLTHELAYLLNLDPGQPLSAYPQLAGSQEQPVMILLDGLNEAADALDLWREIAAISNLFPAGALKWVVTFRANTSADLEDLLDEEGMEQLIYAGSTASQPGTDSKAALVHWLRPMDMKETEAAWQRYVQTGKGRYKPNFSFNDLAVNYRHLYSEISNPLILRLFLELYRGKPIPKAGKKQLRIWRDWLESRSPEERKFLQLIAREAWQAGCNELELDALLKNDEITPYLLSGNIGGPYERMKAQGWISRYHRGLVQYLAFTVEASLFYVLGASLGREEWTTASIAETLEKGGRFERSALEEMLTLKALAGDLEVLSNLVDDGKYLSICVTPWFYFTKTFGTRQTIDQLLAHPTDHDWDLLNKLNAELGNNQLVSLQRQLAQEAMPRNPMDSRQALLFAIRACRYLDKETVAGYMNKMEKQADSYPEDRNILYDLGRLWNKLGDYDRALEGYEKALAIRLKTLNEGHPSVATTYNNIAEVWQIKGDYDRALEMYEKALAIMLKTLGEEYPSVATIYNNIALVWSIKGNYNRAFEIYKKALAIQLKTLGEEHPDLATTYNNIAINWSRKGVYDRALKEHKRALKIRLEILSVDHLDVATTYNNIAVVRFKMGEYDTALQDLQMSLKIRLKMLGADHPTIAIAYNNIASVRERKGDFGQALEDYKRALKILQNTLGSNHPDVATCYLNIAGVWDSKGDYDRALEQNEKALTIRLKTLGTEHPDVAGSYNNMASVWFNKGEYNLALEGYLKCLRIRLKSLGDDHPSVASTYNNIGLVWSKKGNYDRALEEYQKCLSIEQKTIGEEHPDVASTYNNMALVWKGKGDYDRALEGYEKALAIRLKTLDEDHHSVATTYYNIGNCRKALNDKENALGSYLNCAEIRKKNLGKDDKNTQNAVERAIELAKELGQQNKLPEWMK